jgi:thiol-disulfide isomerase/thioredoxin
MLLQVKTMSKAFAAVLVLLVACGKNSPGAIEQYLKDKPAAVFVFLAADCPLSQSYSRTLNSLREQFLADGVEFYGVFPDERAVDEFVATYKITFPVVVDRGFQLTDFFGATKTPEVFAVDGQGRQFYKGAIDNWAPELGQHRTVITEHYLLDALSSLIHHESIRMKETQAVGCFIERR